MRPDGRLDAAAGMTAVRMLGACDKQLARFDDHVLLLRPDRYVAACISMDEMEQGAKAVGMMVTATFP